MSSKQFLYRAIKIIFDNKGLNDIDFRLKEFQDFWLIILTFLCWFVWLVQKENCVPYIFMADDPFLISSHSGNIG